MRVAIGYCGLAALLILGGCSAKESSDSPTAANSGTTSMAIVKEFNPEQGKFTIKMPGDPTLEPADGSAAKAWSSHSGPLSFSIGYTTVGDSGSTPTEDQIKQDFDNISATLPITEKIVVTDEKTPITVAGVSGREIDGTTSDKKATRIRLCVVGNRRYRASHRCEGRGRLARSRSVFQFADDSQVRAVSLLDGCRV